MEGQAAKIAPGARRHWNGLDESVSPHADRLTEPERVELARLLWDDVVTEYDARHLSRYLRELPIEFSPTFWEVEARWAEDEARHHEGFLAVGRRVFDFEPERLAERVADFGPVAHLFEDEFSILCLCAYDELATVRGYSANLATYDRLGPAFGRFVRAVIADEAWHYCAFSRAAIDGHPDRLADAPRVIARIRATEGAGYGATFVLDHEDPVYGDAIFDEAARILNAQFARVACNS